MKISNINNINSRVAFGKKSYKNIEITQNSNKINFGSKKCARKFLKWMSNNFSSPHQRAILGITALCSQPFIDLQNKHIKNEDKPIVVSKTISKIVIGTTVGILLRHNAIKIVQKYTNSKNIGKYSQCLLPKKIIEKLNNNSADIKENYLLNYRNGLGTFLGTLGGLFANFLIDAPLTKILTNILHDKVFAKEKKNVS